MTTPLHRRTLLAGAAGAAAAAASAAPAAENRLGLGFSLYGMRQLPVERALALCREIGYDCVELPVMADWPADSAALSADRRRQIAQALRDSKLRLSALMENLPLLVDEAQQQQNLRRLALAGEVAHDFTSQERPVVETILGGKPQQWNDVRNVMARRLQQWAEVAERARIVIAIKAHVGGAMHKPEHPAELVDAVGSPWIRAAYDYSHFRLRQLPMDESVKSLAGKIVFVHVKDARGDARRVQFLLPGEGDIDYQRLFGLLVEHGYRGDVVVEVSGQIHGRADYDPERAARRSYPPLAGALTAAGIARR